MRIRIASFTLRGARLAKDLAEELKRQGEDVRAYAAPKYAGEAGLAPTGGASAWTREHFDGADALVFVGATGIAVRAIAPHLRSKLTDPAVVSLDEAGRFAVSLVSGHVGGANRLAARIAGITGGQAVVSTATDVNGLFSVDDWIARKGMAMRNPHAVRTLAGTLLEGGRIGLSSGFPIIGALPQGVELAESGKAGLYVGIYEKSPFEVTLTAVPRVVILGLGCRKGMSEEGIAAAVEQVLRENHVFPESLSEAASIDIKAREQGLLDFCAHRGLPVRFYDAKTLSQVPGTFTPSERVLRVTGVDNVCERAAVCSGGRLIVKKTAHDGVTVALAVKDFQLDFEGELR